MIASAYLDGYWAAMDGMTYASNPFECETVGWRSWAEGWEDASTLTRVSDR